MNGLVYQWIPERGYGFLIRSDGRRYFLHIRNWVEPEGVPIPNREVIFELGPGQPGRPPQAINARYLNSTEVEADALAVGANTLAGGNHAAD